MAFLAWILAAVCALRAEHVWASTVWIAQSGENFKRREAEEVASKETALQAEGLNASWREALLTPEQRWDLYVETGGGTMPWLFFGIRSHRLLVASKRAGRARWLLLTVIRLLWLNWLFPIWTGAILILVSVSSDRNLRIPLIIAAVCMCANCLGTLVGGAFSAIAMGGLSRHHDSWKQENTASARAIAELGYSIAAGALFVLSCGLLVQVISIESVVTSGGPRFSADSFAASLNFVLVGSTSDALHLGSQWVDPLVLGAHLAIAATTIVWAIAVASAGRMWLKPAS